MSIRWVTASTSRAAAPRGLLLTGEALEEAPDEERGVGADPLLDLGSSEFGWHADPAAVESAARFRVDCLEVIDDLAGNADGPLAPVHRTLPIVSVSVTVPFASRSWIRSMPSRPSVF